MTVTVTMSKEEFLEYSNYEKYKSSIKCSIIDLNSSYNDLFNELLNDGILHEDKYEKLMQKIVKNISKIEKEAKNDNTTT